MLNDALEALKKLIDALEKKIIETMKSEDLKQQEGFKAMKSIPGFGVVSSAFFSNEMARGSFKSGDQFIAFFGLDLQFKDSGTKHCRRRLSKQGSSEGRCLFNVAMSACRGAFKPMYEHYTSRMSCTQALVAEKSVFASRVVCTKSHAAGVAATLAAGAWSDNSAGASCQ